MNIDTKTRHTLFDYLDDAQQKFIQRLSEDYRLTHQELREICEIATDLQQWDEGSLADWWQTEENKQNKSETRERKKKIVQDLRTWVKGLKDSPTQYTRTKNGRSSRARLNFELSETDKKIYGMCPVYSEDTVCCNLRTIDAVENCGFGCSYCTIQSFHGERVVFDKHFKEKLKSISLDPERFYHIGTGQASDSLMWGNRNGILDDLCEFASDHPNILLEFKTKSDKISYFMTNEVPSNIVLSWSLNTDTIIHNEEHLTAPLAQRLTAARQVADRGIRVAFHFHPMLHYQGWEDDYVRLAETVQENFASEEVLFISIGSLTFIKPVMRQIRERGTRTKILQMPMAFDPKGKSTYPDHIKVAMFKRMYEAFQAWHDRVFMYLCMEKADIWKSTFGYVHPNNEAFEADFCRRTTIKLASRTGGNR